MGEDPGLGRGAEHHAGREQDPQPGEVPPVGLGVEGVRDRAGERVADDAEALHVLVDDRVEQPGRVEGAVRQRDDAAALAERRHGEPHGGAVHQGRSGQHPRPGLGERGGVGGGVGGLVGRAVVQLFEHAEERVLGPHDALGVAGRAARVEQVEVAARASPGRGGAAGAAVGGVLVGHGPVGAGTGAGVDPEPELDAVEAVTQLVAAVGEVAVEDDRFDVGVVPQVGELVAGVAVVGVDRHQPGLERREQALQVLGRVEEELGDLGLVAEPGVEQRGGDAVGALVEVPPRRDAAVAVERGRVGEAVGHRLPHVGVGPALRRAHLRRRPFEAVDPCRCHGGRSPAATGSRWAGGWYGPGARRGAGTDRGVDMSNGVLSATGIAVTDLRRSEDFWTRVIGMERQAKLRLPEMDEVILGFHAKGASLVLMQYTDGRDVQVTELPVKVVVSVDDPTALADGDPRRGPGDRAGARAGPRARRRRRRLRPRPRRLPHRDPAASTPPVLTSRPHPIWVA